MQTLIKCLAICAFILFAACSQPSQAQVAEPFVVKGRVVDERGQPVARAQIVADNQLLYDSNVIGISGPDGRYRIRLPRLAATWNITATATRMVDGERIQMDLDPENPDILAGNAGGVRNFTARSSGTRPDGGSYGATAIVYTPIAAEYPTTDVQLRFEPLDGGAAFTGQIRQTGDGAAVKDVPLGRYRISATRNGRPMQIRVRDEGDYASSVTSGFRQLMSTIYQLELEVR